jgi:hypothetical protein
MSELRGLQGCLTPADLDTLSKAVAGKAPPELAQHVATCPRCQDRMLAGARAELRARKKAVAPPAWRIWAVLGAVLLLLVSVLVTIQRLF